MFSTGHLLWIGICAVLIVAGTLVCLRRRPTEDRLLKICLAIGVLSEVAKLFSVMRILPMVDIAVKGAALEYTHAGQYTPYLEMADLPLELCSLQIAFMAAMLLVKNPVWKSRLRSLVYVTGVIGGLMGIVLAEVTVDYSTVREYFTSLRIYQFFMYHSMVVTLGCTWASGRTAMSPCAASGRRWGCCWRWTFRPFTSIRCSRSRCIPPASRWASSIGPTSFPPMSTPWGWC